MYIPQVSLKQLPLRQAHLPPGRHERPVLRCPGRQASSGLLNARGSTKHRAHCLPSGLSQEASTAAFKCIPASCYHQEHTPQHGSESTGQTLVSESFLKF